MTQDIYITTAATYGMLAVVFGAFGAHALKKILNEDQLKSYEVGIKYQMYHAIVLLILGGLLLVTGWLLLLINTIF